MAIETCTLGGGCFWCLDSAFRHINGVQAVVSGYAAGSVADPTYEQICSGRTGHAEVVQITFDNEIVSFERLLEVFFTLHDPTTKDRQGADVGTQYRSIILGHNNEQCAIAQQVIAELEASGAWPNPVVTQVEPLNVFYPAEPYHQNYYSQNPNNRYCQLVINPKLEKVAGRFPDLVGRT